MISGFDHRVRQALIGILASLLVATHSAALAADAADSSWGLEQLMKRLADVKSSRATFVERKDVRILDAPIESSGTLIYRAPGTLEKHTLRPRPESLVLVSDTLTFEDKARNRKRVLKLQEYPAIWAFVESIRSTLAGDLKTLNRLYKVKLEGSEARWSLTLDPRDSSIRQLVERITIGGSRSTIRSIEVEEAAGDRSLMTITEAK